MEDTEIKSEIIKKYEILEGEIFKECNFYPGYHISNMGRIYSERTQKFLKPGISGIIKKNKTERDGYKFVCVKNLQGKFVIRYIHRLVAENFIEQEDYSLWVNHKNKNRRNNELSNLEFVKPKMNIDLSISIPVKVKNINTEEEILFISISAASRFLGMTYCSIYKALLKSKFVNNYEIIKI